MMSSSSVKLTSMMTSSKSVTATAASKAVQRKMTRQEKEHEAFKNRCVMIESQQLSPVDLLVVSLLDRIFGIQSWLCFNVMPDQEMGK